MEWFQNNGWDYQNFGMCAIIDTGSLRFDTELVFFCNFAYLLYMNFDYLLYMNFEHYRIFTDTDTLNNILLLMSYQIMLIFAQCVIEVRSKYHFRNRSLIFHFSLLLFCKKIYLYLTFLPNYILLDFPGWQLKVNIAFLEQGHWPLTFHPSCFAEIFLSLFRTFLRNYNPQRPLAILAMEL